MNKLKELINKLCPKGVEYKKLEDCCNILDNERKPVTKSARIKGEYPYYGANGIQDYVSDYIFDGTFVLVGEDGSVINKNGNPVVTWAEGKIWVNNHAHVIKEKENVLLRYLYYYIQTINVSVLIHGNIPKLNQGDFRNLRIAVPPLEVQCEIVHILDDFTLLSAELSAELKARQKQYEYYRNEMLKCSDNTKLVKFGDVAKIQRGASPRPISQFITDDENGVNWIKIGDVEEGKKYITQCKEKITIEGSRKSRLVKKGDFILSNSMSFGRPYILSIDGCIHDGWLSISDFQNYYLPDFLYHLLNSNDIQNMFKQKASFGGAVQNLNADIVRNIELPLISLKQQQKIIKVLDKFEIYCNDISEGLPAEIEARQKQYKYYRDKLLTFKELKVNE